jgi:outer membrane lipoprotein-sorting protein
MKPLPLFTMLAALCAAGPAAAGDDVAALLQAADRYRTGQDALRVETQVTVFRRDGSPDKERRYTVFVQPDRKSLVLMRSPAEQGQKVLMLGDDFWLLMPGSQRPLRITPSQKLLGDASTGDIATLSWAQDYAGTLVGEEPCQEEGADAAGPCLHLSLQATRKGVSYQRIELWLGKARHQPVRAELYVQSDKLAKQARFVMDQPAAPTMVTAMVLQDRLGNHKETRVQYLSRQAKVVPETWLNPMFLARNPSLE